VAVQHREEYGVLSKFKRYVLLGNELQWKVIAALIESFGGKFKFLK
jgi:hypothetical protein